MSTGVDQKSDIAMEGRRVVVVLAGSERYGGPAAEDGR